MPLVDVLGHVTYLLIALSFVVRDMLWLRILSIIASLFSISFNYWAPAEPLWLIIFWNGVFIGINGVRIALLVRERLACDFDELETELLETVFRGMERVPFMKLIRIGEWQMLESGTTLATQGEELDSLVLIYSGVARIEVDGRRVSTVDDGDFIGEMSFTTSGPASATVVTDTETRVVRWPRSSLRLLLARNPALALAIQGVLGSDMARKLSERNVQTRSGDSDRD